MVIINKKDESINVDGVKITFGALENLVNIKDDESIELKRKDNVLYCRRIRKYNI